ncbi:MAG: ATP-binding cassette domain-containing protein, partial [Candidatus Binatia bacterium]
MENLELPMVIADIDAAERKQRIQGLLDMVGLGTKGHKRPEELSGGEQQRVAVALSLANDPSLILAD